MKKQKLLTMACLLSLGTGSAFAGSAPAPSAGAESSAEGGGAPRETRSFNQLDADSDGYISREEARTTPLIVEEDTTPSELTERDVMAGGEGVEGQPFTFETLDKDRDGFISREEALVTRITVEDPDTGEAMGGGGAGGAAAEGGSQQVPAAE